MAVIPDVRFPIGGPYPSDPSLDELGVITPPSFSAKLRAALQQAKGRLVNIHSFAASIGGYAGWASNFETKGYMQLVMSTMQQLYGDGGSGFKAAVISGTTSSNVTFTGAGGNWGGGWDVLFGFGINGAGLIPHTAATGSFTDPIVRGSTIDIYWLATTTGGTTFTYNIDGAGAVTVNTTVGAIANSGVGITTITGLAPGNHSMTITATGGVPVIHGWTGRNNTGILPFYMASAGRPAIEALSVNSNNTAQNMISISAGSGTSQQGTPLYPTGPPDLAIISEMGINDAAGNNIQGHTKAGVLNAAPTIDYFISAMAAIIEAYRVSNTDCAIAIHMMHKGNITDPTSRTVTATTALNSNSVTVTTGVMSPGDIGAFVSGTGVSASSYICGLTSETIFLMNQNAASAQAGSTLTIVTGNGSRGTAGVIAAQLPPPVYEKYVVAATLLAQAYSCNLINFHKAGKMNYNYFSAYGFWGNFGSPGQPGNDIVHLSDRGHSWHAYLSLPFYAIV